MLSLIPLRGAFAWIGALLLSGFVAQGATGVSFGFGDVYLLPAGTTIPKDLFVVANEIVIEGEIQGNLASISRRALVTGTVRGDANIAAARIEIQGARLAVVRTVGAAEITPSEDNLGAAAFAPVRLAARGPVAQDGPIVTRRMPDPRPFMLVLVGFAILGATLLALVPRTLISPAELIRARPGRVVLVGLLTVVHFLLIPLGTLILAILIGYFLDWFAAVMLVLFVLAAFGLLWFLSPLVTGVWVGRSLNRAFGRAPLGRPLLVLGIVLVAIVSQIPNLGWMFSLASFILAAGAIVLAGAGTAAQPVVAAAPAPDAAEPDLPAEPGTGAPLAS